MASPNRADLKKKADELAKLKKKLACPETGKQKMSSLITLVRGAIRASWAICPVKLSYHEMGRVADTSTELRKWKMQCECCQEWFKCDEIEIDHSEGNHTFTKPEDFVDYFDNILDVTYDDLQRICKYKCHRIKSHKEKQGFGTMYEACVDKVIIFLVKFVDTDNITKLLSDLGITPDKKAKKRRQQLYDYFIWLELEYEYLAHLFQACDHIMRLQKKYKAAKKFRVSAIDRVMVKRYNDFWTTQGTTPVINIPVLTLREFR